MRRRTAVPLAVAAGLVAVTAARRRRVAPTPAAIGLASRAARNASVAGLAARVGTSYATTTARKVFASAERRDELDREREMRTATDIASTLGEMKGALMKIGQMAAYLDEGLPEPLRVALTQLQAHAPPMAPELAAGVIEAELGARPEALFVEWDPTPIAAASIGQVHKALTHDGRELAVKVQYPGVRESIDADVDNVATLLRLSGLLPKPIDITPLLAEAKRQLHEEADYVREGEQMARFATLLADAPEFIVPVLDHEFSGDRVLSMSFVAGTSVESLADAPQEERDRVMTSLIALVLRELFEFGLMQTDPNFANFRYQRDTGKLVLLDFGAVRAVLPETASGYRALLMAGLDNDRDQARAAAVGAGFLNDLTATRHRDSIDRMIDVVMTEMNKPGPFDFGDRAFVTVLRDQGIDIAEDREAWHIPPIDTLFVQRKISGTALLAARLNARVDVRAMVEGYRQG